MNDEPLVLLHPLGMSARVWDGVRPLLEPHHDVVALTSLGHRGGAPALRRPVSVGELVDDAQDALDARGLDRPHLAGNSLGGWIALELARRGRASTVCALAPAGTWTAGTEEQALGVRKIRTAILSARLARPLPTSLLMRSRLVRRMMLRDAAAHGDRMPPEQAVEAVRDLLGCTVADDVLSTDEQLDPLDPLPCPTTLVWGTDDAILPLRINGAVARSRLPDARFVLLGGVGHVPMIDDPRRVARTILETTARGYLGSTMSSIFQVPPSRRIS